MLAFPFLFASLAAFRPCGPALSPESWRHPGYFSYCFQPCVCDWFSCVWSLQDLEGLGDALLVTTAAATVHMKGDLSKHAAAASAAAVLLPELFEGLLECFDGDISCLVGKFVLMRQEVLVGGFAGFESLFASFCAPFAAARKLLFYKLSKPAAAAFEAFGYFRTLDVIFAVVVGSFVILLMLHFFGGCFALFDEYICIPGGLTPKEEKVLEAILFTFVSLRQSGQVDYSPDNDQGSGEHGIVSSLPVGLGQASGRVDVPDDAKIAGAAAIEGTLHSGPGSLGGQNSVFSEGS